MSNVGYATVSIIPSAKGFGPALNKQIGPSMAAAGAAGGKKAGIGFKGAMLAPLAALGPAMAGVMGLAAIGGYMKSAVNDASDLAEVGTALKTVFGPAMADVEKYAAGGAEALGMSRLEALKAAQGYGIYGKAAGLSNAENAKFSNGLVGLSADLASFYNSSPEEVLEALSSGLRGEAEPLRKYGILLDDATLKQQALSMGLIKTTKGALTPQQKILASHAVIMKQSSVAQGDFQKTSGGLANQQRILSAQWKDLRAKAGGALLPAVLGVVKAMNGLFDAGGKVKSILGPVGAAISTIAAPAKAFFRVITESFSGSVKDTSGLSSTFSLLAIDIGRLARTAGPFLRTVFDVIRGGAKDTRGMTSAVALLAIGIGAKLRPAFEAIKGALAQVGPLLGQLGTIFVTQILPVVMRLGQSIVTNLFPALQNLGNLFVTVVVPAVVSVVQYFTANLLPIILRLYNIFSTQVIPIIGQLAQWFTGTLLPAVMKIVQSVAASLKPVLDQLFATISGKVIPIVMQIIAKFREWMPTIQRVISVVVSIIGWVLKFAAAILGKVLPPVIRFAGFLIGVVVKSVLAVIGVIVKIIGKVLDFGGAVVRAVGKVGEFVSGLKRKFGEALTYVKGIPQKAKDGLGAIGSKLFSAGQDLIRGFLDGIKDMAGSVARAAEEVVGKAISAAKEKLKINSPSKVFMAIGGSTGEGMALGIEKSAGMVTKAADGLVHIPKVPGANGSAASASGSPLVGSLSIESRGNAKDDLDEALFQLRRISRGGR